MPTEVRDVEVPLTLLGNIIYDFEEQEGSKNKKNVLDKLNLNGTKPPIGLHKEGIQGGNAQGISISPTQKPDPLDDAAYSFGSTEKANSSITKTRINYNQIEGVLPNIQPQAVPEEVSQEEMLSISPKKVRRTNIEEVRKTNRARSYVESLRSINDEKLEEMISTGCFLTVKVNTGIQLDKLWKKNVAPLQSSVSLLTVSEVLISKMKGEIGNLFKYDTLIESMPKDSNYGLKLDRALLKRHVLCGINMIPVDPERLIPGDLELYNTIFEILPNAAPGYRKSDGVVCIRKFRDFFKYTKFNLLKKVTISLKLLGAFRLGHLFLIDQSIFHNSSPKKSKSTKFYSTLEVRLIDAIEGSTKELGSFSCPYRRDQDLSWYFGDKFLLTISQEINELKIFKVQILAYSTSEPTNPILLREKTLIPSFLLPGYRSIYFEGPCSSHLVFQLQFFQEE
jgi:hypothetical protein